MAGRNIIGGQVQKALAHGTVPRGHMVRSTAFVLSSADLTKGAAGAADAWRPMPGPTTAADKPSYDVADTGSIAAGLQKWASDVGPQVLKTFGYGMGPKSNGPAAARSSSPSQSSPAASPAASPGHPAPGGKSPAGFEAANRQYAMRQAQQGGNAQSGPASGGPAMRGTGNTRRGTQNEGNLKAIIAARQERAAQAQGDEV